MRKLLQRLREITREAATESRREANGKKAEKQDAERTESQTVRAFSGGRRT